MDIAEAMEIVYQLAQDNALEPDDPEVIECELEDMAKEQQQALDLVHDFVINHLCD